MMSKFYWVNTTEDLEVCMTEIKADNVHQAREIMETDDEYFESGDNWLLTEKYFEEYKRSFFRAIRRLGMSSR